MADFMSIYQLNTHTRLNLKIRRSAKKNFIFRFKNLDTLQISVFKHTTLQEIHNSLKTNQELLMQLYQQAQVYFQKAAAEALTLPEQHHFMGTAYPIHYQNQLESKFTQTKIILPKHLTPIEAKKLIAVYLYTQAEQILLPHLHKLGEQIALIPSKSKLSNSKSYWGICTHQNSIRLNWRLIAAPLWIQEYVIIHELCHIPHKNHSLRFWQQVQQHYPHVSQAKKWLQTHAKSLYQFG